MMEAPQIQSWIRSDIKFQVFLGVFLQVSYQPGYMNIHGWVFGTKCMLSATHLGNTPGTRSRSLDAKAVVKLRGICVQ